VSNVPPIALARLPGELRQLLEQGADNAVGAAVDLESLIGNGPSELAGQIELREQDGDRITHALVGALLNHRLTGQDRGRLLALSHAIDDVVDAVDASAREATRCDCGSQARMLAGVVRDAARAAARAIKLLDRSGEELEGVLAEMHVLSREGNRIRRAALAEAFQGHEPGLAIARGSCLEHLANGLKAAVRVAETVQRIDLAARE
jgi:uncharacterized protein Yka (UPF0111/DUF47 family)